MRMKFAAPLGYHYFIGSFPRSFQYLLKTVKRIPKSSVFIKNTINLKIIASNSRLKIQTLGKITRKRDPTI